MELPDQLRVAAANTTHIGGKMFDYVKRAAKTLDTLDQAHVTHQGGELCAECGQLYPCETRKVLDDA